SVVGGGDAGAAEVARLRQARPDRRRTDHPSADRRHVKQAEDRRESPARRQRAVRPRGRREYDPARDGRQAEKGDGERVEETVPPAEVKRFPRKPCTSADYRPPRICDTIPCVVARIGFHSTTSLSYARVH